MSRQCPSLNRTGEPCTAQVADGKTFCVWHDPERREEAKLIRQSGGRNSSREARAKRLLRAGMESLGDVNDVMKIAMLDVQRGKLDPKIANAMANLAGKIKELSITTEYGEEIVAQRDELARMRQERQA